MEITLNGQLVTCSPKEYKELMDMGIIPGQPADTKAATSLDGGWKDQLAEITKRYPKIEPETPKFGTCTVTPVYGCMIPPEEAKKTFYVVHMVVKGMMKHAYLKKDTFDVIGKGESPLTQPISYLTDNISEALLFYNEYSAKDFVDKWNDYKSHWLAQAAYSEVELPSNYAIMYKQDGRADVSTVDLSAETITLQVKAESDSKITVYLIQFNDSEEPTYLSRDAYGRLNIGDADIRTSDITEALGFYDRERADDFAAVYNSHCPTPKLTVVAKEMPVGTTLNRRRCNEDL